MRQWIRYAGRLLLQQAKQVRRRVMSRVKRADRHKGGKPISAWRAQVDRCVHQGLGQYVILHNA